MMPNIDLKDIPGFPDYAITKDGRVWSKPRQGTGCSINGRWLKPDSTGGGYLRVRLYQNRCSQMMLIHRLVLETYVGPCPKGMQCRHLDGNKQNNHITNLQWGTKKENEADRKRHGTFTVCRGSHNGSAKLTESDIRVIRYLRKVAKFAYSCIAWHFDISPSTVGKICRGEIWQHLKT